MRKDHEKGTSKSASGKSPEAAKQTTDSQPQGTSKQAAGSAQKRTSEHKGSGQDAAKHR